jgi:hypothetical protein
LTDLRREIARQIQATVTVALQDFDVSIEAITGDVELFGSCLVSADAVLSVVEKHSHSGEAT